MSADGRTDRTCCKCRHVWQIPVQIEQLEVLRGAVQSGKAKFTIMLSMRFEGAYFTARKLVEEGVIGNPVLAFAQKSYRWGTQRPKFYKKRELYGGTIPWIGIHPIDCVRWVTGLEFQSVTAHHAALVHGFGDCEDMATALFTFKTGGSALISVDYLRPAAAPTHADDRFRIVGSKGVLEIRGEELQLIDENGVSYPTLEEPSNLFVDFVRELQGSGDHLIRPEDAFRVTEIALKTRDAADTGRTVAL